VKASSRPASPVLRAEAGSTPSGFVRIEEGTFTMGSPDSERAHIDNETQHQVTLNSFYMGKYEVTQKEYQAVMNFNPSYFKGNDLPVEQVSWLDAVMYCNERSRKEGLTPAYIIDGEQVSWNRKADGYRLPTEAEWEYACRAGTGDPFNTGNGITTKQANYNGNYPYNTRTKGKYKGTTMAVGKFAANAWGLYDMHGNVWEWCWDWYGDYAPGGRNNPEGPAAPGSEDLYRVARGGSWDKSIQYLRSAYRDYGGSSTSQGFRLVRNAEQ
jgi:formylglycine-generating enzyme required for sulfatase activity